MTDLRSVEGLKIVVADCETTGLKVPIHICELAFCQISPDLGVMSEYLTLVKPPIPIPCGAAAVHGIRDHHVEDAPTIDQVEFPEGPVLLVCHNVKYDLPLLTPYMNIVGTCCTYVLSRRLLPGAEEHKLAYLSCYCNLPEQISHRALGDVRDCLGLLDYMSEGSGMDIFQLAEYSVTPQRLKVMPFGKHKGMPMEQVPGSYIQWLLNNGGELDLDLKYTIGQIWGL